jgi:hypothetical protein
VGVGGGENDKALTDLLLRVNAHPRMAGIYQKYYAGWEAANGDLLCHFSSVGAWSKWGELGTAAACRRRSVPFPEVRGHDDLGPEARAAGIRAVGRRRGESRAGNNPKVRRECSVEVVRPDQPRPV